MKLSHPKELLKQNVSPAFHLCFFFPFVIWNMIFSVFSWYLASNVWHSGAQSLPHLHSLGRYHA